MATTTGSGGIQRPGAAPPERALAQNKDEAAPPNARDEDSGLTDIRELARSSKQRISQKRITGTPPMGEDVLASSSGAWKAVALPEPAKMVSLPAVADLPSAKEIKKAEKAEKAEKKAAAQAAAVHSAATATAASSLPNAPRSSRTPIFAIGGVAVAAAAGLTIYLVAAGSSSKDQHAPIVIEKEQAPASRAIAAAKPAPAPASPPIVQPLPPAAAEEPAASDPVATPPVEDKRLEPAAPPSKHAAKGKTAAIGKASAKQADPASKVETKPAETAKPTGQTANVKKKNRDDPDEAFDDMLKEAGVDPSKQKSKKPTLEKKELSGDDFKHGMASIASRAQACYKGTSGTASLKLTIAPSGKVTKVVVTGAFAGKPEADCVKSAVMGASFPPWDGAVASFAYSYLLSE